MTLRDTEGLNPDYLAGIVLITDGQIHDVPDHSPFGAEVPVHTLLTGGPDEFDRSVELIDAPAFGMINKEQTLRFKINDFGTAPTLSGEKVDVKIVGNGQMLHALSVAPGETVETKVPVDSVGENVYVIEVAAHDNELTDENNRIVAHINGIRENLDVLMISGAINGSVPSLRQIYKADTDSNLIHLMSMRLPLQLDDTPREELALTPVPLNEIFGEALEKYDLIVFNNFEDLKAIPSRYIKALKERAEKDGALLVTVGTEFAGSKPITNTPIGDVMPVVPTGEITEELFRPQLTADGYRHPITRSLRGAGAPDAEPDWGSWIRVMGAEVEEGRVLMETPSGKPLLVIHEEENSRIAVLLSDSFPLWGDGFEGGGPEVELISRISHWLMRTRTLEEEALRVSRQGGKIVIERQTMEEDMPPAAQILIPGGDEIRIDFEAQISPGVWRTEFEYPHAGLYQITNENADDPLISYIYAGKDYTKEMGNLIASAEALQPIADETGGAVFHTLGSDGTIALPAFRMVEAGDKGDEGNLMRGEGWAGFADKQVQELRGIKKTSLMPDWGAALLVASMMVWGWSRENDHNKIRNLGTALSRRRKDEAAPQGGAGDHTGDHTMDAQKPDL